jgi:hypothetical protein
MAKAYLLLTRRITRSRCVFADAQYSQPAACGSDWEAAGGAIIKLQQEVIVWHRLRPAIAAAAAQMTHQEGGRAAHEMLRAFTRLEVSHSDRKPARSSVATCTCHSALRS